MNVSDVDKIMGIMARLNDYVALVTDLNADYWTRMGFTHKPAWVVTRFTHS